MNNQAFIQLDDSAAVENASGAEDLLDGDDEDPLELFEDEYIDLFAEDEEEDESEEDGEWGSSSDEDAEIVSFSGQWPVHFKLAMTSDQVRAFRELIAALRDRDTNEEDTIQLVHDCVLALFTSDAKECEGYESQPLPVDTFLLLRGISKDGSFQGAHLVTQRLSIMQYSCQLSILQAVLRKKGTARARYLLIQMVLGKYLLICISQVI